MKPALNHAIPIDMNIELIREYCLSKAGSSEDCAFGPDNLLFRVKGKIFACIDLNRPDLIVLKCDPYQGIELRERYQAIQPAWHWNKKHWIEVYFNQDVKDAMVLELVERSYQEVVKTLPKKTLYHFPEKPESWGYVHFAQLDSIMNYLSSREAEDRTEDYLLATVDFQTSGRGQRGNHWEAEAGSNLLFGMRIRGFDISVERQFALNQCVSLSAALAIGKYLGFNVKIKWPNDLYVEDRKIGGMLFEHTVEGRRIKQTIFGIGINVNQKNFSPSVPRPTSICLELGKEVDRAALLRGFVKCFQQWFNRLLAGKDGRTDLEYCRRLFWMEGMHPFRDANGCFEAQLEGLGEDGLLMLKDAEGHIRSYYFKEVEFLI